MVILYSWFKKSLITEQGLCPVFYFSHANKKQVARYPYTNFLIFESPFFVVFQSFVLKKKSYLHIFAYAQAKLHQVLP